MTDGMRQVTPCSGASWQCEHASASVRPDQDDRTCRLLFSKAAAHLFASVSQRVSWLPAVTCGSLKCCAAKISHVKLRYAERKKGAMCEDDPPDLLDAALLKSLHKKRAPQNPDSASADCGMVTH